jgi:hypothetical protein
MEPLRFVINNVAIIMKQSQCDRLHGKAFASDGMSFLARPVLLPGEQKNASELPQNLLDVSRNSDSPCSCLHSSGDFASNGRREVKPHYLQSIHTPEIFT